MFKKALTSDRPSLTAGGPLKIERTKYRSDILSQFKKNSKQEECNGSKLKEEQTLIIDDDLVTESCLDKPKVRPDNVEICNFHLGDERYVVAKPYKGKMQVHIRQFEIGDRGRYPTTRGVALNLEKWKKLEEVYVKDIDYIVENFRHGEEKTLNCKIHLGSNIYITVKHPIARVDIRCWWLPQDRDEVVPTKKGISLTFAQWDNLKNSMTLIKELLSEELEEVVFCENSNDHLNQMGYLSCSNCNPNEYMSYIGM